MAKQKIVIVNIPTVGQGTGKVVNKLDVPELDKLLDDGYIVSQVHQITNPSITTITFILSYAR